VRGLRVPPICTAVFLCLVLIWPSLAPAQSLKEKNEALLKKLQRVHGLSDREMDSIRAIFRESGSIGQGNPAIAKHPVTEEK
jgi:hypothetical protein